MIKLDKSSMIIICEFLIEGLESEEFINVVY